MHRLPFFALVLFLSTGWWDAVVRTTAEALGLNALTAAEQTTPPPPPTTDTGGSMDPWGGSGG